LGSATKTLFADVKGMSLLTAEVPCVGGGLSFHGHVRAATPGKEQPLLHAGAGAGMPCRLQMVLNWAVFEARVWNRTMANFLLQDALDHPASIWSATDRMRRSSRLFCVLWRSSFFVASLLRTLAAFCLRPVSVT
jgi:hypothetical protein